MNCFLILPSQNLILTIEDINNYNKTTKISVEFKRKQKPHKKNIFILMYEDMKKNLNLENNIQYFSNTTFDCVRPQNRGRKLFTLLVYNGTLILFIRP